MTCFDVLQHLPGGGDRIASREIARVLRPGGVAVVRSNSSYRPGDLAAMLDRAGLDVLRSSYANGLPSLAQEVRGRFRSLAGSRGAAWLAHPSGGGLRLDVPGPRVNRLMGGVSTIERRATGLLGVGLPFGHSTMALAARAGGKP